MQLCCVEDPLDLSIIDLSDKDLNQIKEEDMGLFENIVEINASENFLNFGTSVYFLQVQTNLVGENRLILIFFFFLY